MITQWPFIKSDPEMYKVKTSWPKITIITPSYNQGQFIEETILSVINQNYPNLEYIIIDGGSSDNTVEIIEKYEHQISYWVSERDQGQSDAINKGIKKSSGDLFNWVNSDDLLADGSLYKLGLNYKPNIDVYLMDTRIFDKNSTILSYRQRIGKDVIDTILDHLIAQPSTFYKLDIVKKIGGIANEFHFVMDLFLWVRYLLEFGQRKTLNIEGLGAHYREHLNTKTKLSSEKFELETLEVFNFVLSKLKNSTQKKAMIFYDFNVILTEQEKSSLRQAIRNRYIFLVKKNLKQQKIHLALKHLKSFFYS